MPAESLGQEGLRLDSDREPELLCAGTGRHRIGRFGEKRFQTPGRPVEPKFMHGIGPRVSLILFSRLSPLDRVGRDVANIVCDLERLTETLTEPLPFIWIAAGSERASGGCSGKQRSGFGLMIIGERNTRLALPSLAGDQTRRRSDGARDDHHEGREPGRSFAGVPCQGLKCTDDEGVTHQDRERLAKSPVHRGLSAPRVGIVETGQVVMHERSAMQELD